MLEQRDTSHGRFLGLTQLMRPPVGFYRPEDVVKDPALSDDEKREILAAWASDVFAPPDHPGLRWLPGAEDPVPLLEIRDTLRRVGEPAPGR